MSSNDEVILRRRVERQRSNVAPEMNFDDYLELFIAEQLLKRYDLSYEELESGIVDGGDDAGIDAMYTFVNGSLVSEDADLSTYKRDVVLELYVIQSRSSAKFQEGPVEKVANRLSELLDLTSNISDLSSHYNSDLIQGTQLFRETYEELAVETSPDLYITYVYGSLGDAENVHKKIRYIANQRLGDIVGNLYSSCEFRAIFWGARELLQEAQQPLSDRLPLRLSEHPLSSGDGGNEGYVCLVNLRDYYDFITDSNDSRRQNIFESNVRDYQGRVEVNKGIRKTLSTDRDEDFWWLNNGVTVIATNGNIAGKRLMLDDPQIVNGLQTSTEIHRFYSEHPRALENEERSILVRVIVTSETSSRDKIITATNSQTTLSAASLRAHDQIQRYIEDYFFSHDYYYERRKNFYKNRQCPKDRIVSIPYLAQSVMAVALQRPDDSRARPTSLLKKDDTYEEIFNPSYDIDVYLICARIMMACDAYIKSESGRTQLTQGERNNLRFHVATYAASSEIGESEYEVNKVLDLNPEDFDPDFISSCAEEVAQMLRRRQEETEDSGDKIAKSREFVRNLKGVLNEESGTS